MLLVLWGGYLAFASETFMEECTPRRRLISKLPRFGRSIDRLPMKDPKIQREARHYDPAAREYVQQRR
jgi:hypothetical protein